MGLSAVTRHPNKLCPVQPTSTYLNLHLHYLHQHQHQHLQRNNPNIFKALPINTHYENSGVLMVHHTQPHLDFN